MEKIQIMICFDNGKWLCDFITIQEGHSQKQAIDAYMAQYEQIRNGMGIISKLLPSIIHVSRMRE